MIKIRRQTYDKDLMKIYDKDSSTYFVRECCKIYDEIYDKDSSTDFVRECCKIYDKDISTNL